MTERVCVVCGALGTVRWTLDNLQIAAVANLCAEHAAPLEDIVIAARAAVPDERPDVKTPRRVPRGREMKPLLDWTPPS